MADEVEGAVEGDGGGEYVGVQERQQRIQLVQVVLHWRARQQQHKLPPAPQGAASHLGIADNGPYYVQVALH